MRELVFAVKAGSQSFNQSGFCESAIDRVLAVFDDIDVKLRDCHILKVVRLSRMLIEGIAYVFIDHVALMLAILN